MDNLFDKIFCIAKMVFIVCVTIMLVIVMVAIVSAVLGGA